METSPIQINDGKTAAIVSYFSIIGWLIAYFALHKDKETSLGSYHLRQTLLFAIISIGLSFLLSFIIGALIGLTGITALIYVVYLVQLGMFIMWVIGLLGAINGDKKPIPVIGEKAQTLFSSI